MGAREQGFAEGEKKKQLEIARNLLKTTLTKKEISEATELSIDEIGKLRKET